MKRKNVLFMLATLIVAALSTPASAYDFMEDGLCYNINSNGTSVTVTYERTASPRYTNLAGDIVIPQGVDHDGQNYKVTAIGLYAFRGCADITSVQLPESVYLIKKQAFCNCTGLTSVIFTNTNLSVSHIESNAFEGCTSLTEFSFPMSIVTLESSIFSDCTSLARVNFPIGIKFIPAYMFTRCTALENVTGTKYVNEIGIGAFKSCTSLKDIYIPSIQVIGSEAFRGSGLTSAWISSSISSIGSYAYSDCLSLSSVTFDNNTIAEGQFRGCTALKSLTIPSHITTVGFGAFEGCGLTSVTIENGVMGQKQFKNCTQLKAINIGNNLRAISGNAFEGCTSLESVVIPNTVTKIASYAFTDCTNLKKVTLGEAVADIGNNAFYNSPVSELNWNIINYPTPDEYTALHYAYNAGNLTTLTFGDKVQYIPNEIALNAKITSLNIPASVTTIDAGAFTGCAVIEELTSGTNLMSSYTLIPASKGTLKTVTLLDGVTAIPANAFKDCPVLKTVTMPATVEEIGNSAFSGCAKLRDLYCKMPRPFAIDASVFNQVQVKGFCDLHVVEGAKVRYEMMDVWKEFGVIVEDAGEGGGGSGRLNEYDVNADGNVDVGDVNSVLNYILEHN